MGLFLGMLASIGMLVVIGALLVRFLQEINVLNAARCRTLGRTAAVFIAVGGIDFLISALICFVIRGSLPSAAQIEAIYQGPYIQRMFSLLEAPSGGISLSGVFAWMGHMLGKLLLGQYAMGGMLLAWASSYTALCLIREVFRAIFDEKIAEDAFLLLLVIPGSIFFFLPGWPPLLLMILAFFLFLERKRIKRIKVRYSSVAYMWTLAISVTLSAAVMTAMIEGKIG